MPINYGYYLPLARDLFSSAVYLGISPKMEGMGADVRHAHDKNGTPRWVISALVQFGDAQNTESFTLTAPAAVAEKMKLVKNLSTIRLQGLAGGKWTRENSDKTSWTFQITGFEVLAVPA